MNDREWIGVDLDGTLAVYDGWKSVDVIGDPIDRMVDRVRAWLAAGKKVKIFTARVAAEKFKCLVTGRDWTRAEIVEVVQTWLVAEADLPPLEVTATKDHLMVELWDDRCVQVIPNTGRTLTEEHEAELSALRGRSWRPGTVGDPQ